MRSKVNGFEILFHAPSRFLKIRRLGFPFDVYRFFVPEGVDHESFACQKTVILST